MTLDTRYSPETFEQVIGQPFAVNTITRLIKRGEPRPLLLTGPYGTGKTTLARIYARALNCTALTSSGSPCLRCEACSLMGSEHENWIFHEIACGQDGEKHVGKYVAELARLPAMFGTAYRVIFLDEVHLLSTAAQGALLSVFEKPGVACFVCATTEPSMVSGALRSRCMRVPLRQLSASELIGYGQKVCDEQSIVAEPHALALLAADADGHMRNFLIALGQHAHAGALRVENVAEGLDLAWADIVLRTHIALAQRNYPDAKCILAEWTAPPAAKAAALRDALVHVAHIGFTDRRDHPEATAAFLLASPELVDTLITELRGAFGGAGVPPLAYVLGLAELWSRCVQTVYQDGDLQLELTRAAYAISPTDLTLPPLSDEPEISAPEKSVRKRRAVGASRQIVRYKARPEFLTLKDVKGQYQAATMLPQRFGVWFNVRLRMPFAEYGLTDALEAMKFLSDLKRELRLRLRSWTGDAETKLHFVQQTEVDADGGFTTWLVMHVPPAHVAAAYGWVATQLPERVGELMPTFGAEMWRAPQHGLVHRNQWSLMKELWRLIDPLLVGTNGSKKNSLKVLLAVPSQGPRVGGVLPKGLRRWSASGELTTTEWAKAYNEKFGFLSVLEKQKWDALESGWELDELVHRERETARRREEIKKIESQFPPGRDAATALTRERKLRAFFDRLPFDPLRRPRDTSPW